MSWLDDFKASTDPAYFQYIAQARSDFLASQIETARVISNSFENYANDLVSLIKAKEGTQLTPYQLNSIVKALEHSSVKLSSDVLNTLNKAVEQNVSRGVNVSKFSMGKIDFPKSIDINAFYLKVNYDAVKYFFSKKKLFLSKKVWDLSKNAHSVITNILRKSISIGSDPMETAKLLKSYIRNGGHVQHTLIRKLKDGGIRRYYIPKDVKYEALRLVRTETSEAFMNGVYAGADESPFYLGINWLLSATHIITDVCDDYASIKFFKKGDEPFLPHPNCMCTQVPVYENPKIASRKLQEWVKNPKSHSEIEDWYQNKYKKIIPTVVAEPKDFVRESVNEFVTDYGDAATEYCSAITDTGRIILKKGGSQSSIKFTPEEMERMRSAKLNTFIHNHPYSGSFSAEDLYFAGDIQPGNMEIASYKYYYSLTPGKNGWGDKRKVYYRLKEIRKSLQSKYDAIYYKNGNTSLTYQEHTNEAMQILSKEMGYIYKRVRRP